MLENYLKDGSYTVVAEGLFSWSSPGPHGNMQDLLSLSSRYDFHPVPILLYADKDILWQRNQEREYAVPEDEFDDLLSYVMDEKSNDEIQIDVGDNNVSDIIKFLKKYI